MRFDGGKNSSGMDLYQRAEIRYANPKSLEGVRGDLDRIGKELGSEVNFSEEINRAVGARRYEMDDSGDGIRAIGVKGSIVPGVDWIKRGVSLMPFEMYRDSGTSPVEFDGIRFFVPPGYKVQDMAEGELAMMDRVRGLLSSKVSDLPEPTLDGW